MATIAPTPKERIRAPLRAVVTGLEAGSGRAVAVAPPRGRDDVDIADHTGHSGLPPTVGPAGGCRARAAGYITGATRTVAGGMPRTGPPADRPVGNMSRQRPGTAEEVADA